MDNILQTKIFDFPNIHSLTFAYNEVYNEYAKTKPLTGSIEDITPRQLAGRIH